MAVNMKKIIKKLFGKRGDIFISYILNLGFNYETLTSRFFPAREYSDFFVHCTRFSKVIFKAENIFAIFSGFPLNTRHTLKFYDSNGVRIKELNYDSEDFFANIEIEKIENEQPYISFTHEAKPLEKTNIIDDFLKEHSFVSMQHRGYTVYKKTFDSLGSTVHGNFGLINPRDINQSAVRQSRNLFRYTPAYEFKSNYAYHLVFNNPTRKTLNIQINLNNTISNNPYIKICIPTMGSKFVEIKDYNGSISFISRLAICRSIILKNPDISDDNFEAFHA